MQGELFSALYYFTWIYMNVILQFWGGYFFPLFFNTSIYGKENLNLET